MRCLTVTAVAVVLAGGAVAACSSSPPAEVSGPFQTCTAASPPSASPASAPASGLPATDAGNAPRMAAITLPCFAGGTPVKLDALARPAVLNLWASWCGPCRTELPVLQRFADASGGAVTVLGVVTGDTRTAAAAFAADVSVTFPSVFDKDSAVQRSGLAPVALPVTLFVDAQGRVRHVEAAPIPDLSTLEDLVVRYLGVRP
jgi:thiol-disulfide isomerase/thioredoxin